MNALSDQQLLRDYADRHSDAAFAELVRRYVDIVYSAARRMIGEDQSARDTTQAVFLALAQNAASLAQHPVLSGWLHCTARNLAAKSVRAEVRRRACEQEAATMNQLLSAESEVPWERIAPHLDAALGELSDSERDAVMLRYFENKSAPEMAGILGISSEAAQKRVGRGVERLRDYFAKHGVIVGGSGLIVLISTNAVEAAPVGLAATISAAATLAGTTLATTATATAAKAIAMATLQKTLVAATITVLTGAGLYEARQAANADAEAKALRQQQALLADQVRQVEGERDAATNRLASLTDSVARLSGNTDELLKLRGELGSLRKESQELAKMESEEPWLKRIRLLKQRLQQKPEAKIPEFKFLTAQDWLRAVEGRLDTDADYDAAFSNLRANAQGNFLHIAAPALAKYMDANSDQFPTEVGQLNPFFETPPGDDVLQRYQIVPASSLPASAVVGNTSDWVLVPRNQEGPDTGWFATRGSVTGFTANRLLDILAPAMKAQSDAAPVVNGRKSTSIRDLGPFLTTPEQKAAYQMLMQNAGPASK